MDIRLKAAGSVAGILALIFGTVVGLNLLFPNQALTVLAFTSVGYLAYLMYRLKVSQLEYAEKNSSSDKINL